MGLFKRTLLKLFLSIICLTFLLGFRLITANKWDVTESDPTLWLKFCSDSRTGIETTVQEIIDDINNIETSYIRVALYPDDPDNPGNPEEGDSAFTTTKAAKRTINICFKDPGVFAGGQASLTITETAVEGCTVDLLDSLKTGETLDLKATLLHEIGHCLGLAHPQETKVSVMSYFGKNIANLQIDDKMGITHLYPKKIEGVDFDEEPTYGLSCSLN